MYAQTISLFRYLLRGILSRRVYVLIAILLLSAILLRGFILELAIINSEKIALAGVADFLRYSLVLLTLMLIISSVAEDFEFRQFDRLLTMPISRWQYIAAQVMVIASVTTILCLPVLLLIAILAPLDVALYWAAALWLEMLLLGLIGLLAILSLEKVPLAVFFSLAIYFLIKLSGLISQMLAESVKLSDGSLASRFSEAVFGGILYLLPRLEAFAQNNAFFESGAILQLLASQIYWVATYAMFLVVVCLVDFYRKEFNL